jgi:hypothetical protein
VSLLNTGSQRQHESLWRGPSRAIPCGVSRGRTAATAVVLIAIISLCAACSSGGSKGSTAAADQRAAAENRAAAAQARAATAERNAASKLLAPEATKKKARKIRRTTAYTRATTGLAMTPRIRTAADTTPSGDLAAIERTVTGLNAAFNTSVAAGITNSEPANYWVGSGVYSANQCGAFETARGEGIVSETILVHPDTFSSAPGWVDPVIGRVPQGRIYRVVIDEIQTLVTTGARRERTFAIHVSVQPDGRGRLFLRCA